MTDKDYIAALSRQFADLWQRQVASTFSDPATVSSMMEMMRKFQEQYISALTSDAHSFTNGMSSKGTSGDAKQPNNQPSASPLSPGHDDAFNVHCLERLARCEERIADLEKQLARGSAGTHGKAAKPAGKSKSGTSQKHSG